MSDPTLIAPPSSSARSAAESLPPSEFNSIQCVWEFSATGGFKPLSAADLGLESIDDVILLGHLPIQPTYLPDDDAMLLYIAAKEPNQLTCRWGFLIDLWIGREDLFHVLCPALPDLVAAIQQLEPLIRAIEREKPRKAPRAAMAMADLKRAA